MDRSMTELRNVTCHMGSHSVTCHPTQVSAPRLNPSHAGRYRFTYPGGMEGWVYLVTRKRSRRESNSRPLCPESNALTTEPPSNIGFQPLPTFHNLGKPFSPMTCEPVTICIVWDGLKLVYNIHACVYFTCALFVMCSPVQFVCLV